MRHAAGSLEERRVPDERVNEPVTRIEVGESFVGIPIEGIRGLGPGPLPPS